jgi:hypothetical protein
VSLPLTLINSTPQLSSFILHSCTSANPRPSERKVVEREILAFGDYILHKITFEPQIRFSQGLYIDIVGYQAFCEFLVCYVEFMIHHMG